MSDQDRQARPFIEDDETFGGFFDTLENTKPFVKVGIEGFQGSGKTTTAAIIAIGLHQRLKSTKPIAILDSEDSFVFLKPRFDAAGIKVIRRRSRSVADLSRIMKMIREQQISDILLADSMTHLWENFTEQYKREKNKKRLDMQDWGILKPQWKELVNTPIVEDQYSIIFCGRAGYEYENDEVEGDNGKVKREIYKSGIKMKGDSELGYEPDLLLLMERAEDVLSKGKRKTREVWRECTVLKDRSGIIDGAIFRNPTFENFAPAVELRMTMPAASVKPIQGDDGQFFRDDKDRAAWIKRKDIAVEELEGTLLARWPSQGGADKVARQEAMFSVFSTRSWTSITSRSPAEIEAGKVRLEVYIAELAKKFEAEAAAAIEAKKAEEEKEAEALKMKEAEKAAKEAAKVAKKSGKEAKGDSEPAAA